MPADARLFSLVVPVLNEQEAIRDAYAALTRVLEGLDLPYEVIVTDNGSTDATPDVMRAVCAGDRRWKFIRLSRNFGYQNSITAGMLAASGDAVLVIDADLQDPPELIPAFVAKWKEGYDVVYGVRQKRVGEPKLRTVPTMLAMRFITWLSDEVKLPLHSGDFRLITRRVRDAFAALPETTRYVRGMIHWLGYKQIGIPYVRVGRTKGRTKVNGLYLAGFMFNAVFNFSVKPLRVFSLFGLGVLALTAVLAAVYLVMAFLTHPPPGVTTVLLLLLMNLGVLSLGIGVLGEYIGKIYAESKRRPLYLVDYTLNFDAGAAGRAPEEAPLPGSGGEGRGAEAESPRARPPHAPQALEAGPAGRRPAA
jgi:dolichol-phosphate mannosyltransferase